MLAEEDHGWSCCRGMSQQDLGLLAPDTSGRQRVQNMAIMSIQLSCYIHNGLVPELLVPIGRQLA